jgi:hypothetical protein
MLSSMNDEEQRDVEDEAEESSSAGIPSTPGLGLGRAWMTDLDRLMRQSAVAKRRLFDSSWMADFASASTTWQRLQDMVEATMSWQTAAITGTAAGAVQPQLDILSAALVDNTGLSAISQRIQDMLPAPTFWSGVEISGALTAVVTPQLGISAQLAELTTPSLWSKDLQNAVAANAIWPASAVTGALAAMNAVTLNTGSTAQLLRERWLPSSWPLTSSLHQISDQIGRIFTPDLLDGFTKLREQLREWLPDNLRDVDADGWTWLLQICAEDGTCLAWAPRAEIVAGLLERDSAADRQQYLIEHRLEVVEDVEASLEEVDHPELLDLRTLTLQAAACMRDGHDAPAQALLGNVLDTVMRAHGHPWLRSSFPHATFPSDPKTGSHKMIAGAHGTYDGTLTFHVLMLAPYVLVNALKDVFSGADRQNTFNRHLGAHKASAASYRPEFTVAALLNTHAVLRQMDRYLYAKEA